MGVIMHEYQNKGEPRQYTGRPPWPFRCWLEVTTHEVGNEIGLLTMAMPTSDERHIDALLIGRDEVAGNASHELQVAVHALTAASASMSGLGDDASFAASHRLVNATLTLLTKRQAASVSQT